jgi:hypothetical protein
MRRFLKCFHCISNNTFWHKHKAKIGLIFNYSKISTFFDKRIPAFKPTCEFGVRVDAAVHVKPFFMDFDALYFIRIDAVKGGICLLENFLNTCRL